MQFNPDVIDRLRELNISKDMGLLYLLGIYHNLDVETLCSEEVIKKMNLTKIVTKDYQTNTITWNAPLFLGGETEHWTWVKDWNDRLGRIDMSKKAALPDVVKRMQKFFQEYPEYRKEDVLRATENYIKSLNQPKFLMNTARFIFDGAGFNRKSTLLAWCSKLKETSAPSQMKGRIIT